MACAPMPPFVLQMSVRHMKTEESIRDLILFQKEKLLHENVDQTGMLPQTLIPPLLVDIPDDERRGIIRALRWVLADEDIFQRE